MMQHFKLKFAVGKVMNKFAAVINPNSHRCVRKMSVFIPYY